MLKKYWICYVLLLSAFLNSAFAEPQKVISGEYIIQRQVSASQEAVLPDKQSYHVLKQGKFHSVAIPRTKTLAAKDSSQSTNIVNYENDIVVKDCAEIMQDSAVTSCEPNYVRTITEVIPNDPYFNKFQPFHSNPLHDGLSVFDLRSKYAWQKSTGSDDVVVGIIDTGINFYHPDLISNLWTNPNEIPGNGLDDDANGYLDDVYGINAYDSTKDNLDCHGHGSHVAGIIGARGNNATGVSGVAWNVKMIMAKDTIDCGPNISTAAVIRSLEYFYDLKANHGVNIVAVNGSYGGSNFIKAEKTAIDRLANAHIVFVAAAGNNGVNTDTDARYPAAYDSDNIISVANFDNSLVPNKLNQTSNYGVKSIDVAAPGTLILSTTNILDQKTETYGYRTGTSMAAPMVSGALALLASQRPLYAKDYRLMIDAVLSSAEPTLALKGKVRTEGLLNLEKLLDQYEVLDACPNDPNKLSPGLCGCGNEENSSDNDGDGVVDCIDSCQLDPNKTTPGVCGCGVEDVFNKKSNNYICLDQEFLSSVVPSAPKVTVRGDKVLIKMEKYSYTGLRYNVKVTQKVGNLTYVEKYLSKKPRLLVKLKSKSAKLNVSYTLSISGLESYSVRSSAVRIAGK